ncbi:hypothetical protein D3C87_1234640 [compost metagenome]
MEFRRQFQIVVLRARAAAECGEVKPDHAIRLAQRFEFTVLDMEDRRFVGRAGNTHKGIAQGRAGFPVQRRVVRLHLLQGALAVVDACVHVEHIELLLEEVDRRQHPFAVQAIRIEQIRAIVRRHHKLDAVCEHLVQQAVQHHGVRHVADVELVEADQPVFACDALGQLVEGVGPTSQLLQLAMHFAHEFVEMEPRLAHHGHAGIEAVHQE